MDQTRNIAQRVIDKCGGAQKVAEICRVHLSRVHRWTYPVERGGTGGVIPTKHQQTLFEGALARGIPLTPADFFDLPESTA